MEQKFLFCFDFDETLTGEHIFDIAQLGTPAAMKSPQAMAQFMRDALEQGHKLAIVTRNNRANVEAGLALLGMSPADVIVVTDHDVHFPNPSFEGKRKHIEKAQQLAGEGYTPLLVDDDEHNISLAPGGLGLRTWQYDPNAEIQPPPEVAQAHINTLQRILNAPHKAYELCAEHADFLDGRDLETGQRMKKFRRELPTPPSPALAPEPPAPPEAATDHEQGTKHADQSKKRGCLGFFFR